jgi:hypothetical protein
MGCWPEGGSYDARLALNHLAWEYTESLLQASELQSGGQLQGTREP